MRRILKISGQCLSWLLSVLTHSCSLAGRYLSRLLTLALNVTVSPEVLPGAPLEGMPNVDWVFSVGADEKRAHVHCRCVQFCLQHIESTQSPCSNKELAAAYNAAYVDEHFPTLFERLPPCSNTRVS